MPRSRPPRNVFTPRVLGLLQDGNEPGWVFGADTQAVWRVVPLERGFGVFRDWEHPDTHVPRAFCVSHELAQLVAVLLPAEGQEPQFRFLERRRDGRFPVACGAETVMEPRLLRRAAPRLPGNLPLLRADTAGSRDADPGVGAAGHAPGGGAALPRDVWPGTGDAMTRRERLRDLIRAFLGDYLRLVDPESAGVLDLERARFLPAASAVAARIPQRSGESVTVLVQIEEEAMRPSATTRRMAEYLTEIEAGYATPVLLSVVYLKGGRSGVNLEAAVIGRIAGQEVSRVFYLSFGLEHTRAEAYLDRPEPLAWALAALMRPTRRDRAEHTEACLRRIAASGLPQEIREQLAGFVRQVGQPAPPSYQGGGMSW